MKEQHQLNGEIRDREIRLIGSNGEQLGILSSQEALAKAEDEGLDLVKISPNAVPPVCKIMNYGKYKFELAKKERESKKNQKVVELKEISLSMTIDTNDLNIKARQAQKFLSAGNKVKVNIKMRGRQNAYASHGLEVMNQFVQAVGEGNCAIDKKASAEGKNIIMILVPASTKPAK